MKRFLRWEHDLMDIALAAVKLAHQAAGDAEEDMEPALFSWRSWLLGILALRFRRVCLRGLRPRSLSS